MATVQQVRTRQKCQEHVGRRHSQICRLPCAMIHVFFVPGMFGSTIEYVAKSFSNELTPVTGNVLADGSMHSFTKSAHFGNKKHIDNFFKSSIATEISTPIYPFNKLHLPEILETFNKYTTDDDLFVLMYASTIDAAELNMLFQYHKISIGLDLGLDIFCQGNEHNITAWNTTYSHWSDMEVWQLREWISLFYVPWVQEWIDSPSCVDSRFLTVQNTDFLFNTVPTVNSIFNHCGITPKPELTEFLLKWQVAQQYVVDEYNLLGQIVDCSIANQILIWNPTNIIAEAIVQQRLRAKGYEIQCDGLNTFPTDSETLYKLLEKV